MTQPSVSPDLQLGSIAEAIRDAALAVPGVARLHSGTYGEVATYQPGGKVPGVRLRPDDIEVHLVVDYAAPVLEVADGVRAAVRALPQVRDRPVNVVVQDLAAPDHEKASTSG